MFAWSGSVNCIFTQICTIGRLRRIVVIDRSRGVCGESDVGNKKLLAAVVAVSGAFATATDYRCWRKKKTLASDTKTLAFATVTQTLRLAVKNKKVGIKKKRSPQFFLCTPILN